MARIEAIAITKKLSNKLEKLATSEACIINMPGSKDRPRFILNTSSSNSGYKGEYKEKNSKPLTIAKNIKSSSDIILNPQYVFHS